MANSFPSGALKTCTVTIKVTPSGAAMQMEVWIGPNQSTKSATSGKIAFTSTGANQNLVAQVTMPTAAGTYHVYIDVLYQGAVVTSYQAIDDIMVTQPGLVITNVVASAISNNGVTISWDLSDYGTGQVEYGPTVAYGILSAPENSFLYKSHEQTLSGLTPGTLYHFRVRSKNQAGVETISGDYTFTTTGSSARNVGYITWGDFGSVWNNGATLAADPVLDTFTHVIGLALVPTSPTDGRVKPMYGSLSNYPTFVNAVHSHGKKAMVYVYGTTDTLASIIANGQLNALATSIRDFLNTYNLDGVELDFEAPVDSNQSATNALIDAVYTLVHPLGKLLSSAGMAGKWTPDFSLDRVAKLDWIDVMTYDMYSTGYSPNTLGYKHALYDVTIAVMQKWLGVGPAPFNSPNFGVSAAKLNMGIPFYGYDSALNVHNWSEFAPTSSGQNDFTCSHGLPLWINGYDMVQQKVAWALANGMGVFNFSTGYDKLHTSYSLASAIAGAAPPPPSSGLQFSAYLNYSLSPSTPLDGVTFGIAEVIYPDASMNWSRLADGSPLSNVTATAQRCHAAGIPCIVSLFGGYGDSGYNSVYTDPTLRQTMLNNLAGLKGLGVDGIDWDWECDSLSSGQGIAPQKTAFMQSVRAIFGPDAIITITQNWPHGSAQVTYEPAVLNYVNFVQIMCYDDSSIVYMTVNEITTAVNLWTGKGFPKASLIIGIPFQTYTAINSGSWNGSYSSVIANYNPSPAANNAGGAYYNGHDLVLQKAQWVKSQGLGGCFAYNYAADAFGDSRSLSAAIRQGMA